MQIADENFDVWRAELAILSKLFEVGSDFKTTRVRHQMTQVVDSYRSPYFFTTTTGSFVHF